MFLQFCFLWIRLNQVFLRNAVVSSSCDLQSDPPAGAPGIQATSQQLQEEKNKPTPSKIRRTQEDAADFSWRKRRSPQGAGPKSLRRSHCAGTGGLVRIWNNVLRWPAFVGVSGAWFRNRSVLPGKRRLGFGLGRRENAVYLLVLLPHELQLRNRRRTDELFTETRKNFKLNLEPKILRFGCIRSDGREKLKLKENIYKIRHKMNLLNDKNDKKKIKTVLEIWNTVEQI